MPTYVVIGDHTPQTCPGASKRVRDFAQEALGHKMGELAQQLEVEVRTMLHLDPGHKSIIVVDAPSIEAVTELSFESGFTQFNDVQVYPTTPIPELIARSTNWVALYD